MIIGEVFNEATLPVALQRGLIAIRDRVLPNASVVAIDGNFVILSIGTMTQPARREALPDAADANLPEAYVEDKAMLFARVSRNFPNAESYGVITLPYLTRRDGRAIEWQHRNNANAAAVTEAFDRADVGFWSWNWQGAPCRIPEDLAAVVEWGRRCVREGAI